MDAKGVELRESINQLSEAAGEAVVTVDEDGRIAACVHRPKGG